MRKIGTQMNENNARNGEWSKKANTHQKGNSPAAWGCRIFS